MTDYREVLGYVQSGGGSTRFGDDKALAVLGGKTMLARTTQIVASACGDARIVAAPGKYSNSPVPIVTDRWPGQGPLGGILTALLDTKERSGENAVALIVSCDMPFLTVEWLRFMTERTVKSRAEAVVPKSVQGWEPLCACWRASAAEIIMPNFQAGTRKVTEALNALHVEVLDERDWKRFDTNGRLFWNMNTAADYEKARRLIATEKV